MAEPTTPLPDWSTAGAERATLEGFLGFFRAVMARKLEGVSEEDARREACPPSDMTLLGLVRHMADVERNWARYGFIGADVGPIFYGDAHPDGDPDGDFHPPPEATIAEALDAYWAEIEAADAIYAAADLDDLDRRRGKYNLRWILVHLIEEYARHCGHADLLREAIDGRTDD